MRPNWPLTRREDLGRWEVHHSLNHPDSNWIEIWKWCLKTFGSPNKNSWSYHSGWLYFYDEKYVIMYQLRWS